MLKYLDHLLLLTSLIEWTILDIPSINSAIPRSNTTNIPAPTGYIRATIETITTIMPSPILINLLLPEKTIPLTIFSIPANNNKKARNIITDMDPKMGLINTIIDKIRIIIPNPIWAILTHDGDLSTVN